VYNNVIFIVVIILEYLFFLLTHSPPLTSPHLTSSHLTSPHLPHSPLQTHTQTQCETLDDCKMNLGETDYAEFVSSIAASSSSSSQGGLTPSLLQNLAVRKLVDEVLYLRSQSVGELREFLDFVTYEYMIENVMLLLKGTLSGRDVNELIQSCHPLGMFKESTMRSIPTFESR